MNNRLLYPDIVKFFAIFMVTWSHCAQRVSGTIWTNFLGGTEIDLAFNMPLFMIMSGWFLNLDKMRNTKAKDFVRQKFKRLIIPSVVWYFIHQLLSFKAPGLSLFKYYWYLNGLFVCLCFIMLTAKAIKNDAACIIVTIVVILLIPYTDYCHVNFMLPFLWAGYGLRKVFESKYRELFVVVALLIGVSLCPFWDHQYTVYRAPFNSIHINEFKIIAYVYRFTIGFCLSAPIIYIAYKLEKFYPDISGRIANLGQYSLVIYTSSLAILGFVKVVLNYYGLHTNQLLLIDIYSLGLCIAIIAITIVFSNYCRKRKGMRLLFLGES